nr:MAG TPA: hypothetical protein [Caudoviricetes sp.]
MKIYISFRLLDVNNICIVISIDNKRIVVR